MTLPQETIDKITKDAEVKTEAKAKEIIGQFMPRSTNYPWWKDRKVEDMPEYVKGVLPNDRVYKIIKWRSDSHADYYNEVEQDADRVMFVMKNALPATLDDYNAYMETTSQLKDGQ